MLEKCGWEVNVSTASSYEGFVSLCSACSFGSFLSCPFGPFSPFSSSSFSPFPCRVPCRVPPPLDGREREGREHGPLDGREREGKEAVTQKPYCLKELAVDINALCSLETLPFSLRSSVSLPFRSVTAFPPFPSVTPRSAFLLFHLALPVPFGILYAHHKLDHLISTAVWFLCRVYFSSFNYGFLLSSYFSGYIFTFMHGLSKEK